MILDFEKLYSTYYMKVYSYVMNILKNPSEAEEVTQETFMKAMISQSSYKGKSSEFTWLCAIAKNQCNDLFRKSGRTTELTEEHELIEDTGNRLDDIINKESSYRIHKVLHDMEEPYKEVFELRIFGELSFAEIGQIFQKTESWARVTFHRSRLKLKERLDSNE